MKYLAAILLLASCTVTLRPPVYQVKRAYCLGHGIYHVEAYDMAPGNGFYRVRFLSTERVAGDDTVYVVFTVKKPVK